MIFLYLGLLLILCVYSYSQIDLNLTLLSAPWFLAFQRMMIGLGYFARPLSAAIYLGLILVLSLVYLVILRQASKGLLGKRQIYLLFGGICLVGLFSYPAFSHDFFNYLYYPRVLVEYGANPYTVRPLDFPDDLWTRFMHWTHEPYTYGPVFLLVIWPLYLLGFGKFVLTALIFKALFVLVFLVNATFVALIAKRAYPASWVMVFWAFAANPLVVVESVLSPHVDSLMAMFLLLSLYLLVRRKKFLSLLTMLLSGLVKYVTLVVVPLFVLRKISFGRFLRTATVIVLVATGPVVWQREANPWYFLPVVALFVLGFRSFPGYAFLAVCCFGLLARYAPYLYVGSYPVAVQAAKNILTILPVVLFVGFYLVKKRGRFMVPFGR